MLSAPPLFIRVFPIDPDFRFMKDAILAPDLILNGFNEAQHVSRGCLLTIDDKARMLFAHLSAAHDKAGKTCLPDKGTCIITGRTFEGAARSGVLQGLLFLAAFRKVRHFRFEFTGCLSPQLHDRFDDDAAWMIHEIGMTVAVGRSVAFAV